jgi:7-keto-8-aminopelargonate synthetase-like enzyme
LECAETETEIVAMKQFNFLVDDAHGFGTLGKQELEQVRNKEFKMILMFIFNFCKING